MAGPRLDRARTSRSPASEKFAFPRGPCRPASPPSQALVRAKNSTNPPCCARFSAARRARRRGRRRRKRARAWVPPRPDGVLGTAQSPIYTQQLEPTFRAQLWRTLRTLGTAFIILSGVGALADERGGISRGIMGGDGAPKPTPETKTKFADVKGVDEAKGELVEIVEYLRSPAKFTRLGGKLPKGLLLVGPQGTG